MRCYRKYFYAIESKLIRFGAKIRFDMRPWTLPVQRSGQLSEMEVRG